MSADFRIARVTPRLYRCPLETPVVTSFGTMHDRPMLLVEVEAGDGVTGVGEVWCNFPTVGAEHRARLVNSVLAPLLMSRTFASPEEAFQFLAAKTEVLAIQSAEPGPFAQAIAGIDQALWDLMARGAGQPLFRYLNPQARSEIGVYASGLNPTQPEVLASQQRDQGYRAFKLKVGFGRDRDLANLKALRAALGDEVRLMVDANQGWSLESAVKMAGPLSEFGLDWLEEPLRADRSWEEWRALKQNCTVPLAAGENIAGRDDFDAALAQDVLAVIQPDAAKWGGISGCLPVARNIIAAGARYCPHYLGGGVGLLASAHLLAAAGGNGLLEIDSNPNPLRTRLMNSLTDVKDGCAILEDLPGIGISSLEAVQEYQVKAI